ncbi:HAMP domain-containing protein [Paenibacillus sp. LMG 31460]|uniref:HAMP domain-containing protein n=1 Tax=Paenibacillus germinis TaxID=2654979 RepID=A0ABX1Z6T9_9BACL|nr:histidine kinase [Paenibacillus germinis]NOU87608.1 HAMP domain-containing protein [Paenibacillus germinis]
MQLIVQLWMNRSLRTKLFVLMIVVAVIPNIITNMITQVYYRDITKEIEIDRMQRSINQTSSNLDATLKTIVSDMFYFIAYSDQGDELLQADAAPGGLTEDMRKASKQLGNFRMRYPGDVDSVFFYRDDGVFFHDYGLSMNESVDPYHMQWYSHFQQKSSEIWGQPSNELLFNQDKSAKTVYIMMGMYGLQGHDGMLVVRLNPDIFGKYFQHLTSVNTAIQIQNKLGDTLYVSSNEFKNVSDGHLVQFQEHVADGEFLINVSISEELIYKRINQIKKINTIIVSLSIILAFMLSLLFSSKLTRQLRNLLHVMRKVEKGDFQVAAPVPYQDEISKLSLVFNQMVKKISLLIGEVYDTRMEKMAAQLRQREAVILALQNQINPHFLYNTLETINCRAIIHQTPDISVMCTSLAQFFRYAIEKRQVIVPLHKEIEHVRTYLRIQEERFGELLVDIEIPDELLPCPIVKLTLQPLLENAFNYGFTEEGEYGLRIWGEECDGNCVLFVEDNGVGISEEKREHFNRLFADTGNEETDIQEAGATPLLTDEEEPSPLANSAMPRTTGIGLLNVHRRIRLLFGKPYGLYLLPTPGGGVTVQMTVPWKNKEVPL